MRKKINRHPYLMAVFSVILIIAAFIGSTVIAGIEDRGSLIDLKPDPDNYIRLPNVGEPSDFLRPDPRVEAFVNSLVAGTTNPGQTGRNLYNTPADGETWLANDEGNLMYKGEVQLAVAGRTVVIDSVDDLTFLSSTTSPAGPGPNYSSDSGASFFWLDWGNHYIVDPYSIAFSGGTNNPIAGTTDVGISGISAIFRSVLEKDDQKTITIEIAQTGTTGWGHLRSGTTPITVWAPLNSAVTSYDGNAGNMISGVTVASGDSGVTHQVMQITNTTITAAGTVWTESLTTQATGGSDTDLQRLGDKKTWRAHYNSGISVVPVEKTLVPMNVNQERGDIVLIDNTNDLSAWSGSVAGTSYFVMEWGKHYFVDPFAILNSGSASTTGTTAIVACSEVTGILPWVSGTSVYKTVTVTMLQTGNTGYAGWYAGGITTCTLWAAMHPAVTSYGLSGISALGGTVLTATGATYQVAMSTWTGLNSASAGVAGASSYETDLNVSSIDSGGSVFWNLDRPGETVTFIAAPVLTSSVSAQPFPKHLH